jgi:hypothetical protein
MSRDYLAKRKLFQRLERGEVFTHTCWGCGDEFKVTMESLAFHQFICISCTYELRDEKDHERLFPQMRIGLAGPRASQSVEAPTDK